MVRMAPTLPLGRALLGYVRAHQTLSQGDRQVHWQLAPAGQDCNESSVSCWRPISLSMVRHDSWRDAAPLGLLQSGGLSDSWIVAMASRPSTMKSWQDGQVTDCPGPGQIRYPSWFPYKSEDILKRRTSITPSGAKPARFGSILIRGQVRGESGTCANKVTRISFK